MIDHVSLAVSDLERAVRFYEQALTPLGLIRLVTRPAMVGFGKTYPEVWINLRAGMQRMAPDSGVHLCLRARSVAEVDAFMRQRSRPEPSRKVRRRCARTIGCVTMRRLSSITMATESRP